MSGPGALPTPRPWLNLVWRLNVFNPIPTTIDPMKFWRLVKISDITQCWPRGSMALDKYSKFHHKGTSYPSHRVSYTLVRGPIPDSLVIDHLCRQKNCVNPFHLEPVTEAENIRRGLVPDVIRRPVIDGAPVCAHGHRVEGDNVYRAKAADGREYDACRACHKMWHRRHTEDIYYMRPTFRRYEHEHGTRPMYDGGCRCLECKTGKRDRTREERRKQRERLNRGRTPDVHGVDLMAVYPLE